MLDFERYKILLVDDDEDSVHYLAECLEHENVSIFKAFDGTSALDIIMNNHPDIVLSDIIMPGISGWDLYDKAQTVTHPPLFIFMTGYGNIPDATASIKRGVYDYLQKPFAQSKLITVIHSAIEYLKTLAENRYLRGKLDNLKNQYSEIDSLLKQSIKIRALTDFMLTLNEEDTVEDHLKKLLRAALEITGSRKGSIFLYRTKENSLELELVDWTELAPVTQFNADSAQRLFHKSDTISPSSDTAIPLSGEETDSQDQKPYLSISIEDAQTVWGSLHLHGKISGEMYGPEDIIHVSSLIRKSVVVLNGFEYVGQKTIFSIDREKLKKEHQRLQLHKSSLEKSSSALVVLVDQHLKVLYTCDRYKELFGEKAILEQLNEHSIWAAFGKNIQEEFKHLVTNNEPFVAEELLSVNTSSSVRLFKIRMIPLPKNETTQVEKVFLLLLEDITEQEKITKKLLLLENLAIMGRFVAGIAHDLNNPLDGLNRLISILETKLAGKDDYGLFEVIHIAIRRMSNTIKSFLDCTRDALSKTTFTPLSELIEQSIFIMSPILSEKDIRIYKNFTANHLNLDVPTNLYNVFINLIKNAYDAMEKRGNLEISIENGDKSGFIQVVFADNGCGISETIMDDITKPFFTTKEEGTGLGLSLCKKIINSFGGELVIRNRLTQGCEVSVLIPAKDHILQAQ